MTAFRLGFRKTFSSIRHHRNYRLFFFGQVVSVAGTWMQNVALAWLILTLTHSVVSVGILAAARFGPYMLFGLFGGVLADRFDNRRAIMGTQSVQLLGAVGLAALFAQRRHHRMGDLLAGHRCRLRADHRHALTPGTHVSARRPRRTGERRRTQLDPVQRRAHRRDLPSPGS